MRAGDLKAVLVYRNVTFLQEETLLKRAVFPSERQWRVLLQSRARRIALIVTRVILGFVRACVIQ